MNDSSADSIEEKKRELDSNDPKILLEAACKEAEIETDWAVLGENLYFKVAFPNGRSKRWRTFSSRMAERYLDLKLNFTFLGDHDAVLFRESGVIEAAISPLRAPGKRLREIPGARRIEISQPETPDETDDLEESEAALDSATTEIGTHDTWILPLTPTSIQPNLRVEIGSASAEFAKIAEVSTRRGLSRDSELLSNGMGAFPSLRITGVTTSTHDAALEVLNKVSGSVFFELDLHYNVILKITPSLTTERARTRALRVSAATTESPPKNPQNHYPEKPLGLYWYGRSSSGIPLLEYLAYYQVLEYFFPAFSRKDTLEKLRNELLDPRFQADDNSSLVKILNLASGAGRGFGSERDQLKSTITGCTTEEYVRDLINENPTLSEHFSGKQKIKHVSPIDMASTKSDLLTSVANRIYDIRCRIVHTKEDGGNSSVDLLLPFSREAEQLRPDIDLVKFIAQKALIAGASRLHI